MTKKKPIGELHFYVSREYDTKREYAFSLYKEDFEDNEQMVNEARDLLLDVLNINEGDENDDTDDDN